MHRRRQFLSGIGASAVGVTAGCLTLGTVDDGSEKTVNPALTGDQTVERVGTWEIETSEIEHAGIYDSRLVTVQQNQDETHVRGYSTVDGTQNYTVSFDAEMSVTDPSSVDSGVDSGEVLGLEGSAVVLVDPSTGESVWSMDSPGDIIHDEPETRYVFIGEEGWNTLTVVETQSGRERCRIDLSSGLASYGSGYVLLGDDSKDRITCYETVDGTPRWERQWYRAAGAIGGHRVGDSLLLTSPGHVGSVALSDGTTRFQTELSVPFEPHLWFTDTEQTYLGNWTETDGSSGTTVLAFDPNSGERWRRQFDAPTVFPSIHRDKLYMSFHTETEDGVARLSPDSGDLLWQREGSLLTTSRRGVFLRKRDRIARVAHDGELLWQQTVGIDDPASTARHWRPLGEVFVAWGQTQFVALDIDSGQEQRRLSGLDQVHGVVRRLSEDARQQQTDAIILHLGQRLTAVPV